MKERFSPSAFASVRVMINQDLSAHPCLERQLPLPRRHGRSGRWLSYRHVRRRLPFLYHDSRTEDLAKLDHAALQHRFLAASGEGDGAIIGPSQAHASSPRPSPDSLDPSSIERFVDGDEGAAFELCLSGEDAIPRIAVIPVEPTGIGGMLPRNGENGNRCCL